MLIGKNLENVLDSILSVDRWTVEQRENIETGDKDMIATYTGQREIGRVNKQNPKVGRASNYFINFTFHFKI